MSIMKKAALSTAGALLLSTAAYAQVSPTNVPGQWDTINYQDGTTSYTNGTDPGRSYTFTGSSSLTSPLANATCDLTLEGNVVIDGSGQVQITVVDGDISGSAFFCGPLDVEGFPWYAYSDTSLSNQGIPGSASPADADALDLVSGVVDEVLVTLYGVTTVCEGYIPVDFGNGTSDVTDPSFFDFDAGIVGTGGCAVDGTLYSQTNNDVNAW
ncbi:hypothetical protein [Alloalcanivorax sp.]|jgi:hypothetical protein|uniref:hypothetical protein n=1 Tax=Alloalcanivorax sp. TaxID=3020835 RepID=UPI002EBA12CA|nr:hypothetical protein [Pseudomonadota bacterium]